MSNESESSVDEAENFEESLVGRIGSGDNGAEGQLVTHYRRGLYLILRRECGDADLAEDLTQDTLAKVIMNAREGKIQKPRALAGYIRQLGIYTLIDLRRKEKRRKTTPSADVEQYTAADNTSLLDAVDSSQAGELLRKLLDEMTIDRDREILRRFYLIGQDKAIIANELEVTLAHFDRVKSRALLRMRKLVFEHLKAHGAARADLLSIMFIVVLVSGGFTEPTITNASVVVDVGETPAPPHYSNVSGLVCPISMPA